MSYILYISLLIISVFRILYVHCNSHIYFFGNKSNNKTQFFRRYFDTKSFTINRMDYTVESSTTNVTIITVKQYNIGICIVFGKCTIVVENNGNRRRIRASDKCVDGMKSAIRVLLFSSRLASKIVKNP